MSVVEQAVNKCKKKRKILKLFSCSECEKKFSRKDNLKVHLKNGHAVSDSKKVSGLQCPECEDFIVKNQDSFRHHLLEIHKKILLCKVLEFSNVEEFNDWKYEEEEKTGSYFVKTKSAKNLTNSRKTYFVCNRSGRFIPQGSGRRSPRVSGSIKTGKCCPASMTMEELDKKCKVIYFSEHIGHSNSDCTHLRLSSAQKQSLIKKLEEGLTVNEVLHEIQKDPDTNLHSLTKKHLYNLARQCKASEQSKNSIEELKAILLAKLSFVANMVKEADDFLPDSQHELLKSMDKFVNDVLYACVKRTGPNL